VPRDDAYSRVSDPQRYAGLQPRAHLLVERLASIFDVEQGDADPVLTDLDVASTEVVRLVPRDPSAAPLSIGWTTFPGLIVHAGLGWVRPFPQCGCDACDEDAGEVFLELERLVYAITRGRFRESLNGGHYEAAFRHPDGAESSRGLLDPWHRSLGEFSVEWRAWPRIETSGVSTFSFAYPSIDVDARAVVTEHLDAFNAHDAARLLTWFAVDAVWITGTDIATGHTELADLFDDWLWSLNPSLTVVSLVAEGNDVAAQLTERLTVDAETRTYSIAVFFTVIDGKIIRGKVYREGNAEV